jgi:putative RecB family exonuclease
VTETPSTSTAERPGGDPAPAGSTEVPRRPALSPSRAADFKQCPLLYRFRAIDRLPERPSAAQVRGTLVHAVLERLFTLPAAQRVPAAARALVGPAWAQLCADDPGLPAALFGTGPVNPAYAEPTSPVDPSAAVEPPAGAAAGQVEPPRLGSGDRSRPSIRSESAQPGPVEPSPSAAGPEIDTWLAGVGPLLDAYFALEDPRSLEPEARELLVETELESGLLLRGYVDRIDPVPPNGPGAAIRVVDYKTGTAPRPAVEVRALFQMKFYALMLLRLRGRPPAELRLMYLTGPEALSYTPDEAQLHRFGRTLDAMWAAIRAAGATGDFRPNPGPTCAWCSHRARCPAWDGVPPPYPGWPADAATDDTPGADGSGA